LSLNDLPRHVEEKWKAVERKAQIPGVMLSDLYEEFDDALRAYLDCWLKDDSVKQLAQTDG
jgi:hypothetical protein